MATQVQSLRFFFVFTLVFLLASCASQQSPVASIDSDQKQQLLAGLPQWQLETILPSNKDLLRLTPEMERFARQYIPNERSKWGVDKLNKALAHSSMLDVDYVPDKTYSAEDTFFYREGNCLSYAYLFTAMAREKGFRVRFQQVELPPVWSGEGKALVMQKHINVVVNLPGERYVVEFDEARSRNDALNNESYPARIIGDDVALAEFYNNHGVEALLREEYGKAFQYFRGALEVTEEVGHLWVNLGVLYSHTKQPHLAQWAFEQALTVEPRNSSAMVNLARVYKAQGDVQSAEKLQAKAMAERHKNPYYLYALAQHAYKTGDYHKAEAQVLEAIAKREDHHFYYLLGLTFWQQEKMHHASEAFIRAKALSRTHKDRERYGEKISALTVAGR
ncbi:MAG: tetratricopeptide repeat protein [Cellvibrionaceae bacterium]